MWFLHTRKHSMANLKNSHDSCLLQFVSQMWNLSHVAERTACCQAPVGMLLAAMFPRQELRLKIKVHYDTHAGCLNNEIINMQLLDLFPNSNYIRQRAV